MTLHRTLRIALVVTAATVGCSKEHAVEDPALAPRVQKKGRAVAVTMYGAEKVRPNDFIDVVAALKDPQTGETMTMTMLQRVVVLDASAPLPPSPDGEVKRSLTLLVLPEEGEALLEANYNGLLFAVLRNPEDIDIQEERGRTTLTTILTGERINTLLKKRINSIQVIKGTTEKYSGGPQSRVDGDFDNLLRGGGPGAAAAMAPPKPAPRKDAYVPEQKPSDETAAATPAPTRSWFPESFLFQPLIATDAEGRAALNVPVPDRLTTWRVLALAHSANGFQAGTVDEFAGTLPAYVDPVVPGFLIAGDEVRLPLQVVNTTDQALKQPLSAEATLAELNFPTRPVLVPGNGGVVEYAKLRALHVGTATLKATFGTTDAVAREIPVRASGKPYSVHFGGTLGSPRTFEVTAPADLDPETAHLHLLAFPGALALLRSELGLAAERGGVAEDAYALWMAGQAPALFKALDDVPNPDALRTLTLLETQRVIRAARSPDVATAALLTEAASEHPESPLLMRLTQRLAAQVARAQRPDGTFEGGAGWTLQRLLVATADCVRAVAAEQSDAEAKQRAEVVQLRASGAFERNLARIQDGYTAAVVLGSGTIHGSTVEALRSILRNAIVTNPDGTRSLPVPKGVVRPDGQPPTPEEANARAVLALEGDDQAPWRADLGASLLGSYSASLGWGDGQTNRVALRAVAALFRQPLPASVQVSVEIDGKTVAQGELSGDRLKDVLALDAPVPAAAGLHHLAVKADPPVAGLGFAFELQGHTPWRPETETGLELEVKVPAKIALNVPVPVEVSAHAPAGYRLKIHEALPAGVQPVSASLEKLVTENIISGYHLGLGTVDLDLEPIQPGKAFTATYDVVATLAGTLHAPASSIEADGRANEVFHLPPNAWTIE